MEFRAPVVRALVPHRTSQLLWSSAHLMLYKERSRVRRVNITRLKLHNCEWRARATARCPESLPCWSPLSLFSFIVLIYLLGCIGSELRHGACCHRDQHTNYKRFPSAITFTFEIFCVNFDLSYYSRMRQSENCPLTAWNQKNTVLIILEFKKRKKQLKSACCHSRQ